MNQKANDAIEQMQTNPEQMAFGELYGPAMEITTREDAALYFEGLVQHILKYWLNNREEVERVVLSNIGYCAGYYDAKTRERVYRLFNTEHPAMLK